MVDFILPKGITETKQGFTTSGQAINPDLDQFTFQEEIQGSTLPGQLKQETCC